MSLQKFSGNALALTACCSGISTSWSGCPCFVEVPDISPHPDDIDENGYAVLGSGTEMVRVKWNRTLSNKRKRFEGVEIKENVKACSMQLICNNIDQNEMGPEETAFFRRVQKLA